MLREVRLVDHEQVGLGDAGAALAGDLVAPGHVDHVDRKIDELAAELGGEVVPPTLYEEQLGTNREHEVVECIEIVADVFANGSVRAAPRFHGADAIGSDGLMAMQEFGVLSGEDVVRDDSQTELVTQRSTQ